MKNVNSIVKMAIAGYDIAGEIALDWYDIARDSLIESIDGRYDIDLETVACYSAAASFNASPAMQSRITAQWLDNGDCGLLPNAREAFDAWIMRGGSHNPINGLKSSKAECYRVAMLEGSKSDAVVIDRHMLRAIGLKYSSQPRFANDNYNRATDRILRAGRILGASGCQTQALVWYWQTAKAGKAYGVDGLVDIQRYRSRELCTAN